MDDHFKDLPEWRRENFAESQRTTGLGIQLWGSGKIENLKRQLELPSPEIPLGVGKQELLVLQKRASMMLADNHRWRPELDAVITVAPVNSASPKPCMKSSAAPSPPSVGLSENVRVIVRELGTKPAETSLKRFAFPADSIGSCCTACVGV